MTGRARRLQQDKKGLASSHRLTCAPADCFYRAAAPAALQSSNIAEAIIRTAIQAEEEVDDDGVLIVRGQSSSILLHRP